MHQAHPLPHYLLPGDILVSRDEFDAWLQRYRQAHNCPLDLDNDVNQLANDILASLQ